MPLYWYSAYQPDGKQVTGTIDASGQSAAREALSRQKLMPTVIQLASERPASWWQSLTERRVSTKDKLFFTKQLSVLLRSGIPLLDALELLTDQAEGSLRKLTIDLKDGVREGRSLADGLARTGGVFDTTYIQLIRAGESSGRLEVVLDRLSTTLERSLELTSRFNSALIKPAVQLGIAVAVLVGLVVGIVPTIAQTYASKNSDLPGATRVVMALSEFLTNYFVFLIAGSIVGYALFRWWLATPDGAELADRIKLKLPLFGDLIRLRAVVQFCRTFGMLIEAGVNLAESLHIVAQVVDNRILSKALMQAREQIIKQGKIAEYLKQTKLFPAVALYLIKTGEESGKLDTMLLAVADNYDKELTEQIDGLTAALDPIMTVLIGGIVAFIVVAIGQPLMRMGEVELTGVDF